jgi:hypothetical protein
MPDTITAFIDNTQEHEILEGYQGYLQNTLDFSVTNATSVAIVQALKVGAGMWIDNVKVRCITAQGATLTASVGDGAGDTSWDASANLNSAGATTQGTDGTDAYVHGGKYYAAADTIDLTMLTADTLVDTAVVEIKAHYTRHTT